jgi:Predicted metal-dependent enzyme
MSKKPKTKYTSIGGQALIEGVMMRGPQNTAMAVRSPDGSIQVENVECPLPSQRPWIFKIPLLRGMYSFFDSMRVGSRTLMRSAELAGESDDEEELSPFEKKLNDIFGEKLFGVLMTVAMVLGMALAILLFLWLPSACYTLLSGFFPLLEGNILYRSIFEGVFKIVIFILYIFLCTRMKDMHRVFEYHGAEHKTIFCYEAKQELTVENVKKFKRFHPRCGTSFLIVMLIIGIVVGFCIQTEILWLRTLIRLACLPLVMGFGYEIIRFCGKHDNFLTRILSAPGLLMQRLTTFEPDDSQIECAIAAMKAVIPENTEGEIV